MNTQPRLMPLSVNTLQQDTAIDMIATGGPQTYSRDEAIEQTFA
jgi:hypothetical protein